MTRDQVIDRLSKYFDIRELVGPEIYRKYGGASWQFLQTELLHNLLFIREGIGLPIIGNNWHKGGIWDERGHRSNVQTILKDKTFDCILYLSGHVLGCGFDFDVLGMSPDNVRQWIIDNQKELPHKIRLEHKYESSGKTINWTHMDTKYLKSNPKVLLFNV